MDAHFTDGGAHMMSVIISPIAHRFLTLLVFLLIPISIAAPHAVVWEIIFGGLIGLYYSRTHRLSELPQPLIVILLAIPVWGLVTALWSNNAMASVLTSLKVLALVVLGISWCRLTLSLPQSTRKSLINALIGGLFLGILFLIIETWFGHPWQTFWAKSSAGAFAQGALMISLVAWPAILWAFRRPYSLVWRISLVICLLLSIFWALFQIDCDTSFIGLFLGSCVFIGTLLLPRITSLSMRLFLPLIIMSFPFVSLYAFKPENIPSYNTYVHCPSYIDRLYIWNEVASSIFEHPWKGIGMDGTPHHEKTLVKRKWSYIDKQGMRQEAESARFGMHPHNAILQLWLELGLFGVILGTLIAHLTLLQIYRTNLSLIEKAVSAGLFTGTFMIVWVNLGFWQNWWISGLWMIIGLTITMFKRKREINEHVFS